MKNALPRRVTVFSPDIPFPANRGGRADIWRRIQAFRQLAIQVQLICFYDDEPGLRPTRSDQAEVLTQVDRLHLYPILKGWRETIKRLVSTTHTPWHAARRMLDRRQKTDLMQHIAAFQPDWMWLEGPWCGRFAMEAARLLERPIIYRSHNIEHLYMSKQAKTAKHMRDRLAWTISCFGLGRYERNLLAKADWVFDISIDDLAWWQERGLHHASWLPPLAQSSLDERQPSSANPHPNAHDVLFLGNLRTPNNVQGVTWLMEQVFPRVRALRPGTRLTIAGSRPDEQLRELCRQDDVTLCADVPDALSLYTKARVLVNPVRTGSGTHMKMIEMLMMDAPIVTASQGTQGMPAEMKDLFLVADDADAFAHSIVEALEDAVVDLEMRQRYRRIFSVDGVRDALLQIEPNAPIRG